MWHTFRPYCPGLVHYVNQLAIVHNTHIVDKDLAELQVYRKYTVVNSSIVLSKYMWLHHRQHLALFWVTWCNWGHYQQSSPLLHQWCMAATHLQLTGQCLQCLYGLLWTVSIVYVHVLLCSVVKNYPNIETYWSRIFENVLFFCLLP